VNRLAREQPSVWIDVNPIAVTRLHAVRAFVLVELHGGERCAYGINAVGDAQPGHNPHAPAGHPRQPSQWCMGFFSVCSFSYQADAEKYHCYLAIVMICHRTPPDKPVSGGVTMVAVLFVDAVIAVLNM